MIVNLIFAIRRIIPAELAGKEGDFAGECPGPAELFR